MSNGLFAASKAALDYLEDDCEAHWSPEQRNVVEGLRAATTNLHPVAPSYEALAAFALKVAGVMKDGDAIYKCGACGCFSTTTFDECEQCGVPDQCYEEEYLASGNDDEIDALYAFVSMARDLFETDGTDIPITRLPID